MYRLALLALVACSQTEPPTPEPVTHASASPAAVTAPAPAPVPAAEPEPEPAGPNWEAPNWRQLPDDPQIQRGFALATDTHRLLPDNVGNALNCTNCHLAGGTQAKAAPWVGVTTRYPRYRARSGKVDELPERINGCFERSENGTALAVDSPEMDAIVAYMGWLSEGIDDGKALTDVGMPRISAPEEPDAERGRVLFERKCIACHQMNGEGVYGPEDMVVFPPVAGERSFNVGAGMARLNTAAAFIRWNMPQGQEGSLSDQEAYDIATYLIYQDRPPFDDHGRDWPNGDKPEDARY